jgi:hypothetical protein
MTEQLKETADLAVQKLPDNRLALPILSLLEVYEEEKGRDAIVNKPLKKMEKLMSESPASGMEDSGCCP